MLILLVGRFIILHTEWLGASHNSAGISCPAAHRARSILARSVSAGQDECRVRRALSDGLWRKGKLEDRAAVALGFEPATELLG